ncbi:hypothetical protein N800_04530 [Lysobacter daejeonensis GH1-9]|uniref:HPr kinase/phosphorylase C-terminal domain-containing protein n=1 Tax=Lysobacter daejeonensis GH1-9 TaxID=1385517 RepID=A0A0A0EVT8_9GAMM|nr:hypothetical protein [Lysobacter daejeonensis]KGM54335.1 hypothetical protein N800_04530 [Lysobacter daejeonensis GH1-9]
MPHQFLFAGDAVAAGFVLPELPIAPTGAHYRFHIVTAPVTPCAQRTDIRWRHDFTDPDHGTQLTCARCSEGYLMEFPGVATILATPDHQVHVSAWPGACEDAVRHVLLDQALPRLLAQQAVLMLHGALIRLHSGKCVLILGESGRGKSTFAGACHATGATLRTDDGARVEVREDGVYAWPTYPSLRLLPDSLGSLFAEGPEETRPMAGYSAKRRLDITDVDPAAPEHLHAVVVLGAPADAFSTRRLLGQEACMALTCHGFQLDLSDLANVSQLFAKTASLSNRIPVLELAYPRRYELLPEVIRYLEAAL